MSIIAKSTKMIVGRLSESDMNVRTPNKTERTRTTWGAVWITSDGTDVTWGGRPFNTVAPETKNARLPTVETDAWHSQVMEDDYTLNQKPSTADGESNDTIPGHFCSPGWGLQSSDGSVSVFEVGIIFSVFLKVGSAYGIS